MTNLAWGMLFLFMFVVVVDFILKYKIAKRKKKRILEKARARQEKVDRAEQKFNVINSYAFNSPIETPEEYVAARELLAELPDGELKEAGERRVREYQEKMEMASFIKNNKDSI